MRRRTSSVLTALLAAGLLGLVPGPARAAAFSVTLQRIDLSGLPDVRLYFSVTDDRGNSVLGLTDREITVFCDGTPQSIASLQSALQGGESLAAALLFDRSGSMKKALDRTKEAAADFIRRLSVGDQIAVVSFDQTVKVEAPLSPDKTAGERAVQGIAAGQDTALFDAVSEALSLFRGLATKRQAVVILSDGADTKSRRKVEEVVAEAKAQGIPLYAIGLGEAVKKDVLARLASETGGLAFEAARPEDLLALYQKIGEQLQNQYLLTFRPSFGRDEMWHKLEVRYAPAASPPAVASRDFISSTGPGVSASTVGQLERRLKERDLALWAGGGAACGLLLGFLLIFLIKALRSDIKVGVTAGIGILVLTTALGGLVAVILQSLP
jgi:VWFA-related protein